jgi:hypothetical protein
LKRLEVVSPNHIYHVWDKVKDYLASGLELSGGEYNVDHLKLYLTSGQQTLLIIIDGEQKIHGAIAIEFTNFPNERVAYITSIGGRHMTSPDLWDSLRNTLRQLGATTIRGGAHESVARFGENYLSLNSVISLWRKNYD